MARNKNKRWKKKDVRFDSSGRLVVSEEFGEALVRAMRLRNGRLVIRARGLPGTLIPRPGDPVDPPDSVAPPSPGPDGMCECAQVFEYVGDGLTVRRYGAPRDGARDGPGLPGDSDLEDGAIELGEDGELR